MGSHEHSYRVGLPDWRNPRLFDDRGNRMSPTHSNKCGVHYRYYVSHAILQNRRVEAGSVARVPAPEIERSGVTEAGCASNAMRLPLSGARKVGSVISRSLPNFMVATL
jgi:hypothetical protein